MAVAVPAAASVASWLVPTLASAAGTVGGAAMSGKGASRAAQAQLQAQREALEFEKEKEYQRRAEYDAAQRARQAAWDAEQRRRAPYRQASEMALRSMAKRFGFAVPSASEFEMSTPPPDWVPGQSTTSATSGMSRSAPVSLAALSGYSSYTPQTPPLVAPRLTLQDIFGGSVNG